MGMSSGRSDVILLSRVVRVNVVQLDDVRRSVSIEREFDLGNFLRFRRAEFEREDGHDYAGER